MLKVSVLGNVFGLIAQVNGGYPPLPTVVLTGVNVVATFLDNTFGEACVGLVEDTANGVGADTIKLNVLA